MQIHTTRALLLCLVLALWSAGPAQGAFPGDNGKLIFNANVSDSPESGDDELFTIEPDGSGLVRLTDNSLIDDVLAVYSPDGRTIVYSQSPQGATRDRLMVMVSDGSGARELGHSGGGAAWSPDGHTLVMSGLVDFNYELFTLDVNGGPRTQITGASSDENGPVWSPDGATIAFASDFNSAQTEIYSMKSDASEDWVALTSTFGGDSQPEWSPDGTKITFVSGRNGNEEVYVMNADGSGETRLTAHPDLDMRPQWSPDGTKIAFVRFSVHTLDAEVWTMNPDGSEQAQLTENDLFESLTDWQPLHNAAPDCSGVTASPAGIAKHNRTFVLVSLAGAGDPDGDPVSLNVTGVTQDEPVGGVPDARAGATPDTVLLRAERQNRGDGRVYQVAFEASDGNGGTCTGTAAVTVPRRKGEAAVDSAPPSYDSFAP
jgi:dipeptidyl aminopeptidase/acylaminoacyl peptidase